MTEYYGAPTTPTSDYLAHYGIRGMKWGVRKARESGNTKALSRQYAKAQKKLAKLEKRANSGSAYAKRAAALGAGAAATGAAAVGAPSKWAGAWGKSHSITRGATSGLMDTGSKLQAQAARNGTNAAVKAAKSKAGMTAWKAGKGVEKANLSNATVARLGLGAASLGLGAGAAYNAYRAGTTKRAAKKAAEFRGEMNKAFAGTQYADRPKKKRR